MPHHYAKGNQWAAFLTSPNPSYWLNRFHLHPCGLTGLLPPCEVTFLTPITCITEQCLSSSSWF